MSSRLLARQLRALLAQSPAPPGIPRLVQILLLCNLVTTTLDQLVRREQHAGLLDGVPRGRQVRPLEEIITELHRLEGVQGNGFL